MNNSTITLVCLSFLFVGLTFADPDDESFRANVRPTDPLSPQAQQRTFHLPPGFEIQLFASEPDIQKPMNMAFDAAGRLWVSGSVEYPYAAADGKGHDAIKILADTDGDGTADKITTFADGLNIPVGLYPYRDGVVAYSIPNIWFLRDTDGDGKADRREILYGPLGTPRDTHGMQNAFRRGFDGWLYINHGFSNESTITGRDGSSIQLSSGNTYRVRLDGSRVEQFTWGQVNPFGSALLPDGDLVTGDCHSRPLTLLVRGAHYPSFGKPHGGLGFAPDMMQHSHGSTAIAGPAYYTGDNFPAEYHGHLFVGNVMTSRVNHDELQYNGSTPQALEKPDFLTTDDPWFRPVDLHLGPDGALYIADFYNRIIGHYEVPLEHPGRDRQRARIWRVVYRGSPSKSAAPRAPDLSRANLDQLVEALAHPSLPRRMLATDQLTDRLADSEREAGVVAQRMLDALANPQSETARVHGLWVLFRLGRLTLADLQRAQNDPSALVRTHAMRVLSESPQWKVELGRFDANANANENAHEKSPLVRRAAADAAAQHTGSDVGQLLEILERTPADDVLQRYAWRLAIRNQLLDPVAWMQLDNARLSEDRKAELASIAIATPRSLAATFLLQYLRDHASLSNQAESQLGHLCKYLPPEQLPDVIRVVREKAQADFDLQSKLLLLVRQRLQQRNSRDLPAVREWGLELASKVLQQNDVADNVWRSQSPENPWGLEPRDCEDGQQRVMFLSSLPGGERVTGTLRSRPFAIPREMTFYICGHLGIPTQPAREGSFVQLRLADGDAVLVKAVPPRNDVARRIRWELSEHAGKQGYLEIVDGLNLASYAWLAVSRFEPAVVTLPTISPSKRAQYEIAACALVGALKLNELQTAAMRLLKDDASDWPTRAAAARALLDLNARPLLSALTTVMSDAALTDRLRDAIRNEVIESTSDASPKLLSDVMKAAPARVQRQLADALTSTAAGSESLVFMAEQGHAAPQLLQDAVIKQKILATRSANLESRLARLINSLPPANLQLELMMIRRRRLVASSTPTTERGQELFRKHCAACHQIGGQGTLLAPQLDGIGNRGADRVIEDVLDPNRNVDAAFHVTLLNLANGQVVSGLLRREEGNSLVLANQEGKEFVVLKTDIDEQGKTNTSLMPSNFGELLKPDEFTDLMGYLLIQRSK